MLETILLDSRTLLIKTDKDEELSEIIDVIHEKDKVDNVNSFLAFASKNRITKDDYVFKREDCYDK